MKKNLFIALALINSSSFVIAQTDAISYSGFIVKIPYSKTVTKECRKVRDGYFPPEAAGGHYKVKRKDGEKLHTRQLVEHFKSTVREESLKYTASVKMTAKFGDIGGEASAGMENTYASQIKTNINKTNESIHDINSEVETEQEFTVQPGKALQLYEVVEKVGEDYERVYASEKVESTIKTLNYTIEYDYSYAPKALFAEISTMDPSNDHDEWAVFRKAAKEANESSDGTYAAWTKFLTDLKNGIYTTGEDQGSWAILRAAAIDALKKPNGIAQFRVFCAGIRTIEHPSKNVDYWASIRRLGTDNKIDL
jgi:hypothetical protein